MMNRKQLADFFERELKEQIANDDDTISGVNNVLVALHDGLDRLGIDYRFVNRQDVVRAVEGLPIV